MQIPSEFFLKRRKWTVEILDGEYLMFEGSRCRGLCCEATRTITLCGKMKWRKLTRTFMHEFLHACEFEYKLKIPHALVYALEGPLGRIVIDLMTLNSY